MRVLLGGLILGLALLEGLTGLMLSWWYGGGTTSWQATHAMAQTVPYGAWVLALHRFGAHVLVASVLVHGVWSLWSGAAHKPRHVTFAVGLALGLATLAMFHTGTILVADARATRATEVTLGLIRSIPHVGRGLASAVVGTHGSGLQNFTWLHTQALPAVVLLLTAAHMWSLHAAGPFRPASRPSVRYWPRVALEQLWLVGTVVAVLVTAAALIPWLGGPVDPTQQTAAVNRPAWPFLPLYALVERLPLGRPGWNTAIWSLGGASLLGAAWGTWLSLTRQQDASPPSPTKFRAVVVAVVAMIVTLGLWGALQ